MTIENHLYGPPWIRCSLCGVTQPLASLRYVKDGLDPNAEQCCRNVAKCSEWAADLARQAEAFRKLHPELHPEVKP